MKQGPRYYTKPRRRREGKTDYRKRFNLLKSRETRIVVRNSLKNIYVQFVEYNEAGDKILASAISRELPKIYQWDFSTSTTPAAYLTGLLAATRAKEKGINTGVLDIGRKIPVKGSKVFAVLKGVLDAGIKCPHNDEKIPDEERLLGKHLDEKITAKVTSIKSKIIGGNINGK
jgi:large subunit ribosomal protein L18